MKRFLSDFDLHLFGEGTHLEVYERLGSHLVNVGGKAVIAFQSRWFDPSTSTSDVRLHVARER